MSVIGGPKIVNDSLALCLDTTNPKSYPGSGTVWMDLAQGLTFNSSGTLNPFGPVGGVNCLHFNNSGYWNCGTGSDLVDLGGDCTVEFWLWAEDNTERDSLFQKNQTIYNAYEQELSCTFETGEHITYYSRYDPNYDSATAYAFDLGQWTQISIKLSTGHTTAARTGFRSKNGSAWNASYNSNSNVAVVPGADLRVGNGYAGIMESSYIAIVRAYNKMLSDAEILENYNITKERFGL